MQQSVTIGMIGVGRAGGALIAAFAAAGYPIVALYTRSPASIRPLAEQICAPLVETPLAVAQAADLVFIVTPDALIAPWCDTIAAGGGWRAGQGVVHCSGALGREALAAAATQGAATGGFHPLQTLNGPDTAARLRGASIAIDAEGALVEQLRALAAAIGARSFDLDGRQRALYHAAAVMVANFTVTLYDCGSQLFAAIGIPEDIRDRALLPLLRGAYESLERQTPAEALTGPFARGDALTVARHTAALAERAPEVLPLYREMARATLSLARARGLPAERITALARALEVPPGNLQETEAP